MKIITLNLNGLRSSVQKGLLGWLEAESPDLILFQEVRAGATPLPLTALGYFSRWMPAQRAGYSGVALASKLEPLEVIYGLNREQIDAEGRVILARFENFSALSVYVPSGSSGPVRQEFKMAFLEDFYGYVKCMLEVGPLIIGGDFNIAHGPIDLKNWRSNGKNSGFLPQEREWMTRFLALGLTDTHRTLLGEKAEYTWWSSRGAAYTGDVGWRLDYQVCSSGFTPLAHQVHRDARLSDHAALSVEYAPLER
ncbi:MAG: exodeoxyribonuclease III [Pseudopedobacter sp.]|nr:exodeoxyribonuclease III [Deinococcales bacterium]